MPQPQEFAAWASGPSTQKRAEIREKRPVAAIWGLLAWLTLWFAVSRAPSRPDPKHFHHLSESLVGFTLPFAVWAVVVLGQAASRRRILADGSGLHVLGVFGRRTIPWGEVTNFYLRWPSGANPPLLISVSGQSGVEVQFCRPNWLRIPAPGELTAVIETMRGTLDLGPRLESP